MRRHPRLRWLPLSAAAVICLTLAGCGGDKPSPAAKKPVSAFASSSASPSEAAKAPELRGNAATNPACKLLTTDEVTADTGLAVVGVLGLPIDNTGSSKKSESCTWHLDPKIIQASLVVQYTIYPKPPADIVAYYKQVIAQGFGKEVPQLGDIGKIDKHVVDAIYKRAEIHVSLLLHGEATAEDQAKTIEITRKLLTAVPQ